MQEADFSKNYIWRQLTAFLRYGAGVGLLTKPRDKLGELLIPVHDVVPAMVNDQVIVASNDEHIHGPGLLPIEV